MIKIEEAQDAGYSLEEVECYITNKAIHAGVAKCRSHEYNLEQKWAFILKAIEKMADQAFPVPPNLRKAMQELERG